MRSCRESYKMKKLVPAVTIAIFPAAGTMLLPAMVSARTMRILPTSLQFLSYQASLSSRKESPEVEKKKCRPTAVYSSVDGLLDLRAYVLLLWAESCP
jgi:hypothetical protein